jgi:DNA repair protein RadA/Sms
MKITEPAIDLGIAMAIVSSYKNRSIDDKLMTFGEVGLSGEIRAVSMPEQRVLEAKKLGFTTCVLPEVSLKNLKEMKGMKLIGVRSVRDAIDLIS